MALLHYRINRFTRKQTSMMNYLTAKDLFDGSIQQNPACRSRSLRTTIDVASGYNDSHF
ncbi:MAG TPA: hypothetical protein VKF36_25305 [Syntrophorhabdales bacterium]|nr:hypothetical protein [Syntrophorhabdales bacterium]